MHLWDFVRYLSALNAPQNHIVGDANVVKNMLAFLFSQERVNIKYFVRLAVEEGKRASLTDK